MAFSSSTLLEPGRNLQLLQHTMEGENQMFVAISTVLSGNNSEVGS
jgi:hypothetical protein